MLKGKYQAILQQPVTQSCRVVISEANLRVLQTAGKTVRTSRVWATRRQGRASPKSSRPLTF